MTHVNKLIAYFSSNKHWRFVIMHFGFYTRNQFILKIIKNATILETDFYYIITHKTRQNGLNFPT